MQDEDPELHRAAALARIRKADADMVPELIELLLPGEAELADSAHAAPERISGEDFGPAAETPFREDRINAMTKWHEWHDAGAVRLCRNQEVLRAEQYLLVPSSASSRSLWSVEKSHCRCWSRFKAAVDAGPFPNAAVAAGRFVSFQCTALWRVAQPIYRALMA